MTFESRMSQPAPAAPSLSGAPIWVRELSPSEKKFASTGRTGDVLPDGSVLLRQEDMNRMGLEQLRQWILKNVRYERAIVIVGRMLNTLRTPGIPLPGRGVNDLT